MASRLAIRACWDRRCSPISSRMLRSSMSCSALVVCGLENTGALAFELVFPLCSCSDCAEFEVVRGECLSIVGWISVVGSDFLERWVQFGGCCGQLGSLGVVDNVVFFLPW